MEGHFSDNKFTSDLGCDKLMTCMQERKRVHICLKYDQRMSGKFNRAV